MAAVDVEIGPGARCEICRCITQLDKLVVLAHVADVSVKQINVVPTAQLIINRSVVVEVTVQLRRF